MPKSLEKRCIREWQLQLRGLTGSKLNPHWKGCNVRSFCRENGVVSAQCIIERQAEDLAREEWCRITGITHWVPEFSEWLSEHRDEYNYKARISIEHGDIDVDVEDEVREEIHHWCC